MTPPRLELGHLSVSVLKTDVAANFTMEPMEELHSALINSQDPGARMDGGRVLDLVRPRRDPQNLALYEKRKAMASQRELRASEWDVDSLPWPHGPVQCVRRLGIHGWEPWVVVARSAILHRMGKDGLGLFAARKFRRGDYVGLYDGKVIDTFPTRVDAIASTQCRHLVLQGHDKLITRRMPNGGGVGLVDGEHGGPPFLHRINDPRGTRLGKNVELTPGGWVRVTQQRMHVFDADKGIHANAGAELKLAYGDEYWDAHPREAW